MTMLGPQLLGNPTRSCAFPNLLLLKPNPNLGDDNNVRNFNPTTVIYAELRLVRFLSPLDLLAMCEVARCYSWIFCSSVLWVPHCRRAWGCGLDRFHPTSPLPWRVDSALPMAVLWALSSPLPRMIKQCCGSWRSPGILPPSPSEAAGLSRSPSAVFMYSGGHDLCLSVYATDPLPLTGVRPQPESRRYEALQNEDGDAAGPQWLGIVALASLVTSTLVSLVRGGIPGRLHGPRQQLSLGCFAAPMARCDASGSLEVGLSCIAYFELTIRGYSQWPGEAEAAAATEASVSPSEQIRPPLRRADAIWGSFESAARQAGQAVGQTVMGQGDHGDGLGPALGLVPPAAHSPQGPLGLDEVVAIGLTDRPLVAGQLPGWTNSSFGYHGDDGGLFHAAWSMRRAYGPRFGRPGDVVGCGVRSSSARYLSTGTSSGGIGGVLGGDVSRSGSSSGGGGGGGGSSDGGPASVSIFFTLNGVDLGIAFDGVRAGPLHPAVGADAAVRLDFNFGLEGDPPFAWQGMWKEPASGGIRSTGGGCRV